MSRSLFNLLGIALIAAAVSMHSASVMIFFDPASLLLVVGCATFFSLGSHGFDNFKAALAAGLSSAPVPRTLVEQHRIVLNSLRNSLCAAGALGYLIGTVLILRNLADPSALGPAMAVALLTGLYGLLLAELVVAPMSASLAVRESDDDETGSPVTSSGASVGAPARGPLTLTAVLVGTSLLMGAVVVIIP